MKKGTLPTSWIRWRHRRYQGLMRDGLAGHLAWEVAKGEAAGRNRISRVVGRQAAEEADLQCISRDGEMRFVLIGDTAGLTSGQLTEIEQLNRRARAAA